MESLNIHTKIHSGKKPFKCGVCEKCFALKNNFIRHMRLHSGEKPFKCSICEKCFADRSSFNRHIRLHSGEKPFKCGICEKCFADRSNFKQHIRLHSDEKPFKCGTCERHFSHKSTLIKHVQTHLNEKPFKCEICMKSFAQEDFFNDHMKVHLSMRPFKCDQCNEPFQFKSQLNLHRKEHLTQKNESTTLEKCDPCDKRFIFKSQLDERMMIHKRPNCLLCTRSTEECVCSKNPVDVKTNLNLKELLVKNDFIFECQVCFERIYSKFQLSQHLQIHDNYKCLICNQDYRCCSCPDNCIQKKTDVHDPVVSKTSETDVKVEKFIDISETMISKYDMCKPCNEDSNKSYGSCSDTEIKEENLMNLF